MNSHQLVKDVAIKNQAGRSALYGRIIKGKVVYEEKIGSSPIIVEPAKEWGKVYREIKKSPIRKFLDLIFS